MASADLGAGDVLVLYTDGVTEAQNALGEEFGTERLSALLERGFALSAESLMSTIFRTASDFCNQVGFADDVTILVVKCNFDGCQGITKIPGRDRTQRSVASYLGAN